LTKKIGKHKKQLKQMKNVSTFDAFLNEQNSISSEAAYIHQIVGSGQRATQDFIDEHGLDGKKLADYVKNNRNTAKIYDVRDYISGAKGTVGGELKLRKSFIKLFKESLTNESHFKVGDKVTYKDGSKGEVISLDKEEGADDEKYYAVRLENGEEVKSASIEFTEDIDEAMVQVAGKNKPSGAQVLAILIVKYLDDNLIMPSNANKKKITEEIKQLIMDSTY
jgi:hypothetical protein